jgi:hypothetical protein
MSAFRPINFTWLPDEITNFPDEVHEALGEITYLLDCLAAVSRPKTSASA